ncbi:MAG TPA: hypothetical protein VG269_04940 [Tepidisphaeraceae bacterium]|jgi:hypothetical protein|nr:hypothetical protein [Tepidisphaeraceae bacterium]
MRLKNTPKTKAMKKAQMNSDQRRGHEMSAEEFIALPDTAKARLIRQIERKTPEERLAESRPLNSAQRAQWKRIKKKMGRPRVGKGSKVISLSIERHLLKQADALAKRRHVTRARVVAEGLALLLKAS